MDPRSDKTVIRLNGQFLELANLRGYKDLDRFGMRLSEAVEESLRRGLGTKGALEKAISNTATAFFAVNHLAQSEFIREFGEKIRDVVPRIELIDYILRFKSYAERQLAPLLRARRDEETFRSAMQTHLDGNFLTYREVQTGGGQSDILIAEPFKELIETKVWRGPVRFGDGLIELAAYLSTEQLNNGYYVLVEFGSASRFLEEHGADRWIEPMDGKTIEVVFVRIPDVAPSKAGERKRASVL